MVRIQYGESDPYSRETIKGEYPAAVDITIETKGEKLMLLFASEMEVRNTGAEVGVIKKCYEDG